MNNKDSEIKILDRDNPGWGKRFKSANTCRTWLMDGFAGTDGAERERYSSMLMGLACGDRILYYG